MSNQRSKIILETVASCVIFASSSAIYSLIEINPLLIDFILLAVGSFLPSSIGTRIGSLAGVLFGPIVASHISTLEGWDTYLPLWFLKALILVGGNGKLLLGLFGAFIGAISYAYLHNQKQVARFLSNVLASAFTGLSIGAIGSLLLLILGAGNKHPAPNLMITLLGFAIHDSFWAFIIGAVIGMPTALVDSLRCCFRDRFLSA
jgi:ABC-type phosphate/phosphonate transport system permease subunit